MYTSVSVDYNYLGYAPHHDKWKDIYLIDKQLFIKTLAFSILMQIMNELGCWLLLSEGTACLQNKWPKLLFHFNLEFFKHSHLKSARSEQNLINRFPSSFELLLIVYSIWELPFLP